MKNTMHLLARLGLLALPVILSIGAASAQTDIGKAIQEKLAAEAAKLENSCADDIKKYCSDVTPGEGRMIYCMQAHEDKITPKCAFDLEEAATDVQLSADNLKEAITACKAEITGVCGKTEPGQGANSCMPDRQQIDGLKGLWGCYSKNRSYGGSLIPVPPITNSGLPKLRSLTSGNVSRS